MCDMILKHPFFTELDCCNVVNNLYKMNGENKNDDFTKLPKM